MTRAVSRLVDHAPQSHSFAHPEPVQLAPKTVLWTHHTSVLNGASWDPARECVARCMNADYFATVLPKVTKGQPPPEHDAVTFHEIAARLDGVTGQHILSDRRWQLQPSDTFSGTNIEQLQRFGRIKVNANGTGLLGRRFCTKESDPAH